MRLGSLCTGIGGLDEAVMEHYRAELAWYSEVDPHACKVLEVRYPGVPNLGDLKQIEWERVPPVDVMCAGYPCQPFSHAGKRGGVLDERHLWPHIYAGLRILRPSRLVAENVAGHLSLGFDRVLGDLAAAGFDAEWEVVRASDIGACHRRARLFIVATDSRRERHGGLQNAGVVGRLDRQDAGQARERERSRTLISHRSEAPPSNAGGGGWDGRSPCQEPELERRDGLPPIGSEGSGVATGVGGLAPADAENIGRQRGGASSVPPPRSETAWGPYDPAIRRHERVLGRVAPAPVDNKGRLSPVFVEWMQMFPEGWVTDIIASRTAALRLLGNSVVSPAARYALELLEAA